MKEAMSKTLFISDLHLSAERVDITQCFLSFLENETIGADALYILGDLFEVWLGDDDVSDFSQLVAHNIRKISEHMPVYFIHGNRDFAIKDKYSQKCNMTILPEQSVIELYGKRVLISHGDELCTRDIDYMKFRKKARSWWWPRLMLAIPLTLRKKIAIRGRQTSKDKQARLTQAIMDVTQVEVEKAMIRQNVDIFIHGHTHRPAIHSFENNKTWFNRIVLGDWYSQGSYLEVTKNDFLLKSLKFHD